MSEDTPLLRSLRAAVAANTDDVPLRLHFAQLLLDADQVEDAISHIGSALQRMPNSPEGRALMARAMAARNGTDQRPQQDQRQQDQRHQQDNRQPSTKRNQQPVNPPVNPPVPAAPRERQAGDEPTERHSFNWIAAEYQFAGVAQPFVDSGTAPLGAPIMGFDVEQSQVRLADVGGMTEVKQRLNAAFLAPMRNPELRRMYGKSLRGGLLLYGPPGCGKTFLARAVAGELGARFLAVTLADVLDMWLGSSERNLRDLFAEARRAAPCVLFLDEIDALGHKRSQLRASAGQRGTVNQLLSELDGVQQSNEGVFVLAATNHPWDVDSALRRPGRLDRMLLVLPPDLPAREAILHYHLRERPVAGVNVRDLAKRTEDYSGADLAHLCETAAERALLDSARTGKPRPIGPRDFDAALAEVRPSTGAWLSVARNVAVFGNGDGSYDELHRYLKRRRMA
ncbi:MAG TPA: tetratricopeptide repeat protein [Pseudonocardiaceae bacterium]|nr:tetratricopeptide repeat protein [Pseudonocardiaceae bacterium]